MLKVKKKSKEVLLFANKYHMLIWKQLAEKAYFLEFDITDDNFCEQFQLSKSENCGLLYKKVLDFLIVEWKHRMNAMSSIRRWEYVEENKLDYGLEDDSSNHYCSMNLLELRKHC